MPPKRTSVNGSRNENQFSISMLQRHEIMVHEKIKPSQCVWYRRRNYVEKKPNELLIKVKKKFSTKEQL